MHQPHPPVPRHEEHLRLLAIFHYVFSGILAFFSLFALVYVFMGVMMSRDPAAFNPGYVSAMDRVMARFFVWFGGTFLVVGEIGAVFVFLAGRAIAKRKRFAFVFAVACVECIFMPLGTVLGVFTLIKLTNGEVRALFGTRPDGL